MNTRGFLIAAATVAALLLAVGCGSSSDPEVTVQTGSLSKAKFIEKADAICEAARSEFGTKYTNFVEAHKSDLGDKQKEEALLSEVLESVVSPNLESEIKQISELGAPSGYAPEVASFLNAIQKRLDEIQGNPTELTSSPYPFKKAESVAKRTGMDGCSESFG